jgi:hypothetical protein
MADPIAVPVPTKTVPFSMRRNTLEDRIKKDEEELEALKKTQIAPGEEVKNEDEPSDENLTAEEKTFKKRYGDLRRHSQKVENDLRKEVEDLKKLVEQTAEKQMKLPARDEDIDAWAKQYPDVYRIVESIALKKAKETQKTLEERMRKVDETERQTARDKARVELLKAHPDFDKIEDSDDFHDWAEEQPKWVQDALYENDDDYRSAARAIDLYKADRNISKKNKTVEDNKAAAQAVNTRSRSTPNPTGDQEGVFYESQVQKMSIQEYEKNQEDIVKAMRSGKFVYDITGNAR